MLGIRLNTYWDSIVNVNVETSMIDADIDICGRASDVLPELFSEQLR